MERQVRVRTLTLGWPRANVETHGLEPRGHLTGRGKGAKPQGALTLNPVASRASAPPTECSARARVRHRDVGGRVPAGGNRGVSAFSSQPGLRASGSRAAYPKGGRDESRLPRGPGYPILPRIGLSGRS
jgi:hypothetical protein